MERYWFKAKRYGFGWYPASWEGWIVMLVWLIAFVRLVLLFMRHMRTTGDIRNLYWYLPLAILITGALMYIAWLKGEPPRWRWGGDK